MIFRIQKVRKSYWTARFQGEIYRHVGEGRTEREALGDLLKKAHEAGDVHGLLIERQPDGEFAHLRAGQLPH